MNPVWSAEDVRKSLDLTVVVRSGSKSLDALIGGGYSPGKLFEFFGRSNSGKTQVAMQAVLAAAASGHASVFIDSEGTFRPERVESMAAARGWERRGLLDRIAYVRVNTSAEQADAVRALSSRRETAGSRLVVVDTITRNFTLDYPGGSNTVRRQGALDVHLSEMARDAVLHNRTYVLTNRVTFDQSGGETRIGGSTIEQLVHASIHLTKDRDVVTLVKVGRREKLQSSLSDRGLE